MAFVPDFGISPNHSRCIVPTLSVLMNFEEITMYPRQTNISCACRPIYWYRAITKSLIRPRFVSVCASLSFLETLKFKTIHQFLRYTIIQFQRQSCTSASVSRKYHYSALSTRPFNRKTCIKSRIRKKTL